MEEEQQQQARHLQRSCINYLQWPKISRQAAGEPERRRRTRRHVDGGQEELQIELSSASWNNAMAVRYADTQRVERGQKKRGRRMPAMPARELAANCALNCGSLCSMVTELNHRLHFCHRRRGHGSRPSQAIYNIPANSLGVILCQPALPNGTKKGKTRQTAQLPVYPVELCRVGCKLSLNST